MAGATPVGEGPTVAVGVISAGRRKHAGHLDNPGLVDDRVPMGWTAAVREAGSVADLVSLSGNDAMFAWAAGGGLRSFGWISDHAIGLLGTDLSLRDRLMVSGHPEAVAALADRAWAEHHPAVRLTGDSALITAVARIRPDITVSDEFGWMQATPETLRQPDRKLSVVVEWLPDTADSEVAELLGTSFPGSEATPGGRGVQRWAGIREAGQLIATACEAWSAPDLGFMAGVTVAEPARGRGLARMLCAAVLSQLCAERGRAALMADQWNIAAVRLYRELGMTWRPIRSARHPDASSVHAPVTS
jgi:ribosomal protein S18 acetylase RimI-like enzyme